MFKRYWIAAIAFGLIVVSASAWYSWREMHIYQLKHAEQRNNVARYNAETSEQFLRNCIEAGGGGFFTIVNCIVKSPDANREAQRSK